MHNIFCRDSKKTVWKKINSICQIFLCFWFSFSSLTNSEAKTRIRITPGCLTWLIIYQQYQFNGHCNNSPDWTQFQLSCGSQTDISPIKGVYSRPQYDKVVTVPRWYHRETKTLDDGFISNFKGRELAGSAKNSVQSHIPRDTRVTQKIWEVNFATESLCNIQLKITGFAYIVSNITR